MAKIMVHRVKTATVRPMVALERILEYCVATRVQSTVALRMEKLFEADMAPLLRMLHLCLLVVHNCPYQFISTEINLQSRESERSQSVN